MPLPQLVPGMVFAGDYRVVRHLSAGGMGAVYVVEQVSTQRLRALKIMLPDLVVDPRNRERFTQEATVSGRIQSDHIVEVIAAGIDAQTGTPWMCMELLEGQELAKVVQQRGALTVAEVLEVVRQLGHGLGAAHRAGLVHRDLKPENIFLCHSKRDGVPFTVKILDFGIAKVVGDSRQAATATSAVGSPLWMAPEQAERGQIRAATDCWALGLIVFNLLTGTYYWRSAQTADTALPMLLKEIFVDALEPASMRAAAFGRGAALPANFDAWFGRCVVRDASQRFNDANEATAALLPLLGAAAGVPVQVATYPGPLPQVPATVGHGTVAMQAPPPMVNAVAYPTPASMTTGVPGYAMPQAYAPQSSPSWPQAPQGAWGPTPAPATSSGGGAWWAVAVAGLFGVVAIGIALVAVLRPRGGGGDGGVVTSGGGGGFQLPGITQPPVFRGPQCKGTGLRTPLAGLSGVVELSAGRYHTCARDASGAVSCWGWNNFRQLGDNTTEDHELPVRSMFGGGNRAMRAGEGGTCVMRGDLTVSCVGLSVRGPRGEPYTVPGVFSAATLSVGGHSGCSIAAGGSLCWGMNMYGQLGDGTDDSRQEARAVQGLPPAARVEMGGSFACALVAGGAVYCWGQQEHGQLGHGHHAREAVTRPVQVLGLQGAVELALGENHACVRMGDGTVRCWGANEYGQAGADQAQIVSTPTPVQITGVAQLAVGYSHTCAIRTDRTLWCWGQNLTCQLGTGSMQAGREPLQVPGVQGVEAVAAGGMHTCMVVRGQVYCWGFNNFGQLGNGTTSTQPDI